MLLLGLVAYVVLQIAIADVRAPLDKAHYFPDSIPHYEIRRDKLTNETVSTGRMHLINYSSIAWMIPPNNAAQKARMVTFADLDKHLQCASPEPELDGNRGSWSLLKLAPPTKESIENIAAWAESRCHPWVECRERAKAYKLGQYDKGMDDLDRVWGMFRGAILLRVINNEVYYDWPWGIERFHPREEHYSDLLTDHFSLLEMVLRTVSDIGDSVFFFGGERAFMRWNVPFPTFSFARSLEFGDFPFPWLESYHMEWDYYREAEQHHDFSDATWKRQHLPWEKRQPRAAFFASFQNYRQLVYDAAALRPDLFDVSYGANNPMAPWNPLSDEREIQGKPDMTNLTQARNHTGFIQPIFPFSDGRGYNPHHYKYVVVPVGNDAQSTSGRLAGLLAHSGAVVLLQQSSFSYHFTARLQPWVHYVPLSFSMADIIDKVEWLRNHDDLAQQIVKNAENYARSYLRLEDYFCYAATSLKLLSEMENKTTALQGFSPRLIHRHGGR